MSGFSSGRGGPGSGGEGTVREGGSDEEEEQLVSVQIVAAFSLFPLRGSRWVRLGRILLSDTRLGPARRFQQDPGSERLLSGATGHGSGGSAQMSR